MSNTDFEKAKLWHLPSVDDALSEDESTTNALNRPRGTWKYEAPEEKPEIKPLTAQDIESIRESAYQEGFALGKKEGFEAGQKEGLEAGKTEGLEQGQKEGYEQGLEKAKPELEANKHKLDSLLQALESPLNQVNEDVKKELVLLAMNLAKCIVDVECKQNQETLISAIDKGIGALPINETEYQITVSDKDIEWAKEYFDTSPNNQDKWSFIASDNMQAGGCKIQTVNNAVDVSIEKRSTDVFSQLLLKQGLANDPRSS